MIALPLVYYVQHFFLIFHQNYSLICVEMCTPLYGRYLKDVPDTNIISNVLNVFTWEECGNICHEHQDCQMWTWNVPLNTGIRHSLIRGVLIQSCSAGAKIFTNYVFCHVQFNSPGQSSKNYCANKAKF